MHSTKRFVKHLLGAKPGVVVGIQLQTKQSKQLNPLRRTDYSKGECDDRKIKQGRNKNARQGWAHEAKYI